MDLIHIRGGVKLQGKVSIQGSKNAVLPILAATILTKDISIIENCPKITDVEQMLTLLRDIGCVVTKTGDGVQIDATKINGEKIQEEAASRMRSSLCLLGVLVGRFGEITMPFPGGCRIGQRPIDLHLFALRQMGVKFIEYDDVFEARVPDGLHGANIIMPKISVGATENVILAAMSARGTTVLQNAASEPEVQELCRYLVACGANIQGIGSDILTIEGGCPLHGTRFRVCSDRIVAGTYLFACMGTGGDVLLEDAPVEHMREILTLVENMGAELQEVPAGLYVQAPRRPRMPSLIQTDVYPGFPTDLQSMILPVLTKARGQSLIYESIFENRFLVFKPLIEMGARIRQFDDHSAQIFGPSKLHGKDVTAQELRGGAALVIAGLMAQGETIIRECQYINRGYENISKDLLELGARIYCE
ncbi:MAG: UDP-N-acetylglucosamine 1-carboxyvinyltransferase [Clostridium sp.]|jgi:UDP-N-acetylglucosamine 1-carboxyvinyltransferase|nr:UDP-N-acetylglucosamine 1-carboxyvinyltransferase [Clostridium sp.]